MKAFSNDECIEILEYIKSLQWRIEITGEEWYDGDRWLVVIKSPVHDIESEARVSSPKTMNDAMNNAIQNLRYTRNGRNIMFGYYNLKKMQRRKDEEEGI